MTSSRPPLFVILCNFVLGWAAILFVSGFVLLVLYGAAILVFRHAYGIELPNPFALFGALKR